MRFNIYSILFLLICSYVKGQDIDWYSETESNGIIIQNSFPKGGPYKGPVKENFNHSYLVFFSRVINETGKPIEINVNFSSDAVAIPYSPDTFMKLILPRDTMTLEKRNLFSYGITELEFFEQSTKFQKKLEPKEECLFYVVAFFYQTSADKWKQERGGNRAELILKGRDLYYNLSPQVNSLLCGHIIFNK